jgi:hypothetical protein
MNLESINNVLVLRILYDDLVMPNFGDSLLALVGISAAAHVGFTYLEQERSTSFIDRQNR